jgi:hypothetical protein
MLVQLDDLKSAAALGQVTPVAFLTFNTNPGNQQGWVAVSDALAEDFARRLKKGAGADPTASGATRIDGRVNFKTKYMPDYPRGSGLRCAPEERPARILRYRRARPEGFGNGRTYQRCLDGRRQITATPASTSAAPILPGLASRWAGASRSRRWPPPGFSR